MSRTRKSTRFAVICTPSPVERLEDRRLLSGNVTPAVLLLGSEARLNTVGTTAGATSSITPLGWSAGLALHLRAVDTINEYDPNGPGSFDTTFMPTGNGSVFTNGANPDNTRFTWDFGDTSATASGGDTDHLVGFNAAHVYDTPGKYTITLTATDQNGVSQMTTAYVQITTGAPSVINSASSTLTALNPQTVPIGASTSDVSPSTGIVFVDTSAPAGGNGQTLSTAFNSYNSAFKAYVAAAGTASPITQIRFKRGETFPVTFDSSLQYGVTMTDLIVGAYGTGANPKIEDNDTSLVILLWSTDSSDGVTFQDLDFTSDVSTQTATSMMGYGEMFLPGGTDVTMRRCAQGDADAAGTGINGAGGNFNDAVDLRASSTHGFLYDQNTDNGHWNNDYGLSIWNSSDDIVITGNSFTGGSWNTNAASAHQPFFRIDTASGHGGRVLIEGNVIEPSATNLTAMTFRTNGYLEYVEGNTIGGGTSTDGGQVSIGNKTETPTGVTATNSTAGGAVPTQLFVWSVYDSNRMVNSAFFFDEDEVHLTYRNNVIERYLPTWSSAAFGETSELSPYAGSGSPIVYGTTDVEIAGNTVYSDDATAGNTQDQTHQLLTINYSYTPTGGSSVGAVTNVQLADNLMVDATEVWGSQSYKYTPEVLAYSANQFTADYDNVLSYLSGSPEAADPDDARPTPVLNGTAALVQVNGSGEDVNDWDDGGRQTANANVAMRGYIYDDESQAVSINNDLTGAAALAGKPVYPMYAPTYGRSEVGAAFPGLLYDFYGSPRAATVTAGAVQTSVVAPKSLTGKLIGTTTYSGNNAPANAVDQNLGTFFDGSAANGDWVGLDLSTAQSITAVAYASRTGYASRMDGGVFQASNDATFASGVVTLYTVGASENPRSDALTRQALSVSGTYRYVRYLAPSGSYGDVSEVQFFGATSQAPTPLVLTSTTTNDVIYLGADSDGTDLDVWQNVPTSSTPRRVALSTISSVTVNAGSNNEAVTVLFTGATSPLGAGGLTFNGGVGADSLEVDGSTGSHTVMVTSALLTYDGIPLSYSSVASLRLLPGGGTDSVTVNSGSLTIPPGPSSSQPNAATFSSVTIAAGARLLVANAAVHAGRTVMVVSTLSDAGQLDLGGNDMIIHSGSVSAITGLAATGFASGYWNGQGLSSSSAAADSSHLTSLGVLLNAAGSGAVYSSFDGIAATATDVLVKYTYYGDANLDGVVNAADYTRIDAGYTDGLTGWTNGDFNYDGVVNGSDYTLIDNAFNQQGSPM